MADEIKFISIKEFREQGYLQEVNRRFFHPLGLALAVEVDDETGEETLRGLWDYREDPEGIYFDNGEGADVSKMESVDEEWLAKRETRVPILGYMVQPLLPTWWPEDD